VVQVCWHKAERSCTPQPFAPSVSREVPASQPPTKGRASRRAVPSRHQAVPVSSPANTCYYYQDRVYPGLPPSTYLDCRVGCQRGSLLPPSFLRDSQPHNAREFSGLSPRMGLEPWSVLRAGGWYRSAGIKPSVLAPPSLSPLRSVGRCPLPSFPPKGEPVGVRFPVDVRRSPSQARRILATTTKRGLSPGYPRPLASIVVWVPAGVTTSRWLFKGLPTTQHPRVLRVKPKDRA